MEAPRIQRGSQSLQVHQDAASNDSTDELTESRGPLEDSGCTKSADSDNEDAQPEASVLRDMRRLEESFRGISRKYKLIDRIGEGKGYILTVLSTPANRPARNIFNRLQSTGPRVLPLPQ